MSDLDDIQYSDCHELGHEHHGWDGRCSRIRKGERMEGRLYTAQEIFDALQEGTENLYVKNNPLKNLAVAKLGADIAHETMRVLGFDKDKVIEYCKKKKDDIDGMLKEKRNERE